jgi:hypothetical protein
MKYNNERTRPMDIKTPGSHGKAVDWMEKVSDEDYLK